MVEYSVDKPTSAVEIAADMRRYSTRGDETADWRPVRLNPEGDEEGEDSTEEEELSSDSEPSTDEEVCDRRELFLGQMNTIKHHEQTIEVQEDTIEALRHILRSRATTIE